MSLHNYKQEYFKQLISKRLNAYDAVERVIKTLDGKIISSSVGGEKYKLMAGKVHLIFTSRENFVDFFAVLINAKTQSVWLSTARKEYSIAARLAPLCDPAKR